MHVRGACYIVLKSFFEKSAGQVLNNLYRIDDVAFLLAFISVLFSIETINIWHKNYAAISQRNERYLKHYIACSCKFIKRRDILRVIYIEVDQLFGNKSATFLVLQRHSHKRFM